MKNQDRKFMKKKKRERGEFLIIEHNIIMKKMYFLDFNIKKST
jgi:hypothetical protein